jgi:hypothetical protein
MIGLGPQIKPDFSLEQKILDGLEKTYRSTFGLDGMITFLDGAESEIGDHFLSVKAEIASKFTADLEGSGDDTLTWSLGPGDSITGPFSNIREVKGKIVGHLAPKA